MEKVEFGPGLFGFAAGPLDAPGVIVIQEWWGVNETIKEIAEAIASWGPYRVLIPDLYKGKVGVTAEEASHLMGSLDFKAAAEELKQAAAYLRAGPGGVRRKVGCTGFCMGGALSFAAACEGADLDCIAPFYGVPDARYFQIESIKVPILAQFGALDMSKGFADVEAANAAEKRVKDAGGDITVVIHPTGGHGFFNMLAKDPKAIEATLTGLGFAIISQPELQHSKELLLDFFKKHLQ